MKRTVRLVSEEPERRNGKARLFAYGIRAVAKLAEVNEKTVRRAAANGLKLDSLASVLAYIERQRDERHE